MPSPAVLLLNLGSPDSTSVPDVKRYLREFLGDERVIDKPDNAFLRSLLVNFIISRRAADSAHAYSTVWTAAGSPLIATSKHTQTKLQAKLDLPVELAMNYGNPSIPDVLAKLAAQGVTELLLFPQYPHYAMSSWETVVVKVRREAAKIAPKMHLECVAPYFADEDYITALVESARPHLAQPHDHLLFSYHSIPVRHLTKADSSQAHCQVVADCCNTCSPAHATCYKAQITRTTQAFAKKAGLDPANWSIAFQSRLANEPWLEPYTDFEFKRLAAAGKKRLLVITPAFVTDCLETLEEIRGRGAEDFTAAGGKSFHHIPCLNDQPVWIDFLERRVRAWQASAARA
ncbi:ferrochelatase [Opitutus sp. GAS368]|jgi:ferrochelatase|uniref:ferrochelatase n=1 Tax=Opitutus sp. GAS368 TaxID=1882749 RepID=UPI000879B632|nr:ferrochelatase [Opitutus sp. GAS368]SDR65982.1 ferrochelatase [Opitutus sp. GAS368]